MIPRTNRLVGDSPKDPSGFKERVKEIKKPHEVTAAGGYVNERLSAEAAVRAFYSKTIPANYIKDARYD